MVKIPGNMKLIGLALAAGVAFAIYKNDLANKLLASPALGLSTPPAPSQIASMPEATLPPMGTSPAVQQPVYPAAPTGIPGVPNPMLSSLTGMPVLPSASIAQPYPIGNSPYAPFPFQVQAGGPGPYPGFPYPQAIPPGYTIPNINQVQGLPPFQTPPGGASRVDFYNPANPPPQSHYAHVGTRAYKAGKFGSMRDSAFQVRPLEQEAISNSYRRPAFYAPETLSNI